MDMMMRLLFKHLSAWLLSNRTMQDEPDTHDCKKENDENRVCKSALHRLFERAGRGMSAAVAAVAALGRGVVDCG